MTAEAQGSQAVIPPRSNRLNPHSTDQRLYKDRNLLEGFFNRIKQIRRIATRYDSSPSPSCPSFISRVLPSGCPE